MHHHHSEASSQGSRDNPYRQRHLHHGHGAHSSHPSDHSYHDDTDSHHSHQESRIITIHGLSKPLETAPELKILEKRDSREKNNCCLNCFAACRNWGKVGNSGLGKLKRVRGRTQKTIEFVKGTANEYTMNLRFGEIRSRGKDGAPPVTDKVKVLKDVYEKSARTLAILHQCITTVKTIIFNLSFTRYTKDNLTEEDVRRCTGKTVIGSCIWLVTCALQQLQEDPEMEYYETLTRNYFQIAEVAHELQDLVNITEHCWTDLLHSLAVIHRVINKCKDVFDEQVNCIDKLSKEPEVSDTVEKHKKLINKHDDGALDLRNFKPVDPYSDLTAWEKREGNTLPRLLVTAGVGSPDPLWNGFDPLPVTKKLFHMREVMHFVRLIYEEFRRELRALVYDLQGFVPHEMSPEHSDHGRSRRTSSGHSFEDGLIALSRVFEKPNSKFEWSDDEAIEFFDVHKIFMDDLDTLALGAGVIRMILNDSRLTLDVCYETCRTMDYKEFSGLPSYRRIHSRYSKDEGTTHGNAKNSGATVAFWEFDADKHLPNLRNIKGLFRISHYRKILEDVPFYTNRVGFTLQEPESVFSGSSTRLLS